MLTVKAKFEDGTEAFTPDEWRALSADEQDSFDDYVWQDQPSKEAAIARHEEAMDLMRADNGPQKATY